MKHEPLLVSGFKPADIQLITGMLDTMTDHVFLLKTEGERYRLVYCNQAMEKFMNNTHGLFMGRFLDEIVEDPQLYQRIADNYARVIAAGKVIRYEETTEGLPKAPLSVFETSLSPLTTEDGTDTYICGISRNITARRNAELALQKTNEQLELQLEENRRLQAQLREEAIRDPLTDLFNRRYFIESLKRELGRARREQYPVTLLMIDIDYFKDINDRYGHSTGDQVLVAFSEQLRSRMRREDVVCRWGGEEFLVMMPGLDAEDARERIDQWRREYSPMDVDAGGVTVTVRFSSGLATAPDHGCDPDTLIRATDTALYGAKKDGRDRLHVFDNA